MKTRDRDVLLMSVSAEVAGHVCIALQQHRKWARTAGLAVPDELDQLERALANRARRGQAGTPLEDLWTVRHSEVMAPRLLTYAATAQVLGVGERTVKRLVQSCDLTPVRIGGSARIRVEELEDYIDQLTTQSISSPPSPKDVTSC